MGMGQWLSRESQRRNNHRNNVNSYHFLSNPTRPRTCHAPNHLYLSWPCEMEDLLSPFNKWGTERLTDFPRVTQLLGRRAGILTQCVQQKSRGAWQNVMLWIPFLTAKQSGKRSWKRRIKKWGRGLSYQRSNHIRQLFVVVLNSGWNCPFRVYLETIGEFSVVTMTEGDEGKVLLALSTEDWIGGPKEPIMRRVVQPPKRIVLPPNTNKSLLKKQWYSN